MKYSIVPLEDSDFVLIDEKIGEYENSIAPPEKDAEESAFVLKITDEKNNVIAGCAVEINDWGIAEIEPMWVEERYRGQGIGSALLREAERISAEKGCHLSTLLTHDWQAKGFYEKHGYTLCCTIEDWPKGHREYMFEKWLDFEGQTYAAFSARSDYEIEFGNDDDIDFLIDRLDEYDSAYVLHPWDGIEYIEKKLIDEEGNLIAGIISRVYTWEAAQVVTLWVEEPYRNKGFGSKLLNWIETEVKEKGCTAMRVNSPDWSVEYFKKRGYAICGATKDYPKGHSWYYLKRSL